MLRLIVARLVGGLIGALLRPILALGLLLAGGAAAVELSARVWLMYGDPHASALVLGAIRWVVGGSLFLLWVWPRGARAEGGPKRAG